MAISVFYIQVHNDAVIDISYVSDKELSPLAWRLKGCNVLRLREILGLNLNPAVESDDERDPEERIQRLLSAWREDQLIGSDIRRNLVLRLHNDFPAEKKKLMTQAFEKSKTLLHP